MKTKKRVLSAGLTFAAALFLAACGQFRFRYKKLTHQPLVEIQLLLTIY